MYFETIADCTIFKGLDADYLKVLIEEGDISTVMPSKIIVKQGDLSDGMYIILEGKLEVVLEDANSDLSSESEKVISTLNQGSFFGEIGLLSQRKRVATIRAVEKSILLFLSSTHFHHRINEEEIGALKICHHISETLVQRLEKANQLIASLNIASEKKQMTSEMAHFKEKLLQEVLL